MAAKGRTTSRGNARVYGSNFNNCRLALFNHKARLAENLKKRGSELPLATHLKFRKTLLALTIACDMVKDIPCSGMFMSLELPLLKTSAKGGRRAKPRRGR